MKTIRKFKGMAMVILLVIFSTSFFPAANAQNNYYAPVLNNSFESATYVAGTLNGFTAAGTKNSYQTDLPADTWLYRAITSGSAVSTAQIVSENGNKLYQMTYQGGTSADRAHNWVEWNMSTPITQGTAVVEFDLNPRSFSGATTNLWYVELANQYYGTPGVNNTFLAQPMFYMLVNANAITIGNAPSRKGKNPQGTLSNDVLTNYTLDTIYKFRVEIPITSVTANQKYKVYVNNQLVLYDVPYYNTVTSSDGIFRLNKFVVSNNMGSLGTLTGSSTLLVDNVRISKRYDYLSVGSPAITDRDGNSTATLSAAGHIGNISITNGASNDSVSNAKLIATLMSPAGKVEAAKVVSNISIASNAAQSFNVDMTLPDKDLTGYTLKFFVWDALSTISPMANMTTYAQ